MLLSYLYGIMEFQMYWRACNLLRMPLCRTIILLIVLGCLWTHGLQTTKIVQQVHASGQSWILLPIVRTASVPVPSQFYGAEVRPSFFLNPKVLQRSQELGGKWTRLNAVSWRNVQPTESGEYKWSALAKFDTQLAAAVNAGLTPIVIVEDPPAWATGKTDRCGPIDPQHLNAFAEFLHALATRYKTELPYHIDYWEISNEPDVDPNLTALGSYGDCWGDIADPYYGGGRYGDMLKVATPAIKSANPDAKVLIGGLLLWAPLTTEPGKGNPERFFEGILRSGAQDAFDIVAYHDYAFYSGKPEAPSLPSVGWDELGGMSIGKPTFLRQIMAKYNVSKPLMLNETAFLCYGWVCNPSKATPEFLDAFFEVQADAVAPLLVRALSQKVDAVLWYTLNHNGWAYSDLLDARQEPRPVYYAYRTLVEHTGSAVQYPVQVNDYGKNVEAYRFVFGDHVVDVVWSPNRTDQKLQMPQDVFTAAYDRDGKMIVPFISNGPVELSVSGSVVYIHRIKQR
jgi:hypothetical protein